MTTEEVIEQYNEAFRRHEPALLDGLIAEDCVIEDTGPAPDGARHIGREACLARWAGLAGDTDLQFQPEHVEIHGDLAVIRWILRWGDAPADHVRGVNLMRVRDGEIVEGAGYLKA
jgi:ketosteroid isomerase-like protein